ncbi:MAG TPA: hypothetical protein PLH11_01900 [Gemmobacter sp.]|nr:hypothetical protein [Gemmobacter sp.]
MTRALICLLTFALLVPVVARAEPAHGMIRAETALPRTFPLVLRLPPGQSGHLTVTDPATGVVILTAYGRAGTPLRVLVPPGDWSVRVATGTAWQDETRFFGPDTRIETFGPLRFDIHGLNARKGYVLTLRP